MLLEQEELHLLSILRNMHDGVIVVNNEGIIEMVNPAGERLMEKLTTSKEGDFLLQIGDFCLIEPMELLINNRKPYIHHKFSTNDGTSDIILSMIITPVKGIEQNVGIIIALRDITHDYEIEQQLLHTKKLSALGEIVAGIAHEINNPLAGIMGLIQLLQKEPNFSNDVKRRIDKIFSYTDRAKDIIQNLLTFAAPYDTERENLDINQLLEQTLEMFTYNTIVNDISVEKELDFSIPQIAADRYKLLQLFFNLINNAQQVLAEYNIHRKLTIKTWRRRNYLVISLHNPCIGITNDELDKMFDPFFTTKDVAKGTGLGLSIAYGIVQQHKGNLYVDKDEKGKGITFFVELPVSTI